jgi:hypothetical protein
MDDIPTGELNIASRCDKCGSNELSIPDDATDGSAVNCSVCGDELGRWGDVKSVINQAA